MCDETEMLECRIGVLPFSDGSGYQFEVEAEDDNGRKLVRIKDGTHYIKFEWHEWLKIKDAVEKSFEYLTGHRNKL